MAESKLDWRRVPGPVASCCRSLWEAGYQAYPVGGCVRDLLLGRSPGDWDAATSALPQEIQALFPHTLPTGLKHGTVTVLLEDMAVEVTTFRGESGYSDGRHPDAVVFGVGLEADLARRDFTINAMALAPDGAVIDRFGGLSDLKAGYIRCVGDPDQRFREDALRMLRGIRFAAQLGFSLEAATLAALTRNAPGLDKVSGERVKVELEKLLLSTRPQLAALPVELGMLQRFGAEEACPDLSFLQDLPLAPEVRWRAFCRTTGLDIASLPVERRIRRAVLREERPQPALSGGDLYRLGLRGREIGRTLRALEVHIAAHPEENTQEALLLLVKRARL